MFYFLQQFKCIYQSKLNEIESLKLSSEEILQKKFDLSQEYIHDLAEQNIALVQTAEELRESAESRVSILEKLLQRTSTGYKEYMKKLKEYYEEFQTLAYGRLHLDSKLQVLEAKEVQMNEDICSLKIKNSELLHNTSILVQFINSARNKGTWDLPVFEEEISENNLVNFLKSIERLYFGVHLLYLVAHRKMTLAQQVM